MLHQKRQLCRRPLQFESLSARTVLSANAVSGNIQAFEALPDSEDETYVLSQSGNNLIVVGLDADNVMQIELGHARHKLTIDGDVLEYDAAIVRQIMFAGGGGQDQIEVRATTANDRVSISGTDATLSSLSYRVLIEDFETIRLAGGQGDDRARIVDSPGDDNLFLHSSFAAYVANGSTTMKLTGFERVEASAEAGGSDRVNFYDTAGDDRFVMKDGFSFLVGNNFWNYAKGFERIDGYHRNGGNDEAHLYDSAGDDVLTTNPTEVIFRVGSAVHTAHGFPITRTFATLGNDTATLSGQEFVHDVLSWDATTAFLRTTGTIDGSYPQSSVPNDLNPSKAVHFVTQFDFIEVFASDPGDRAELTGTSGDDTFIGLPQIVRFSTDVATVQTHQFGLVRAFGGGGNDRAHLQDSTGDDRYIGKAEFSFMRGPNFVNYVSGFTVDAVSTAGHDYAEVSQYTGPDDYLIFNGTQFLLVGPARNERISGFASGRGIGSSGAGLQILASLEIPFRLSGSHDNQRLPSESFIDAVVARSEEPIESYLEMMGQIVPLSVLEEVS